MCRKFYPGSAAHLFAAGFIYRGRNETTSRAKEWMRSSSMRLSLSAKDWDLLLQPMTGNKPRGTITQSSLRSTRRLPAAGDVCRSGIRFQRGEHSQQKSRNILLKSSAAGYRARQMKGERCP